MTVASQIEINGQIREILADGSTTLLDVLRDQLGLTGAKRGCSYGICGACTVLIDGKPGRSCLALALNCETRSVATIEGLSQNDDLHPIQRAISDAGVQCGFCITGVVMVAKSLLDRNPQASEAEIRSSLSGNMCRCSGYTSLVMAIKAVAEGQYE